MGNTEGNSGEIREPVIVVSDVHLGSESCNYKQFCDFLVWIRSLDGRKETIKCEDKELVITYPEKFILLGDILELWDPIDGDRDNVVKQSIRPFSLFWAVAPKPHFGYTLVWAALTGFFALSSIPGIITRTQRKFYDAKKPKDKTAEQIIEDEYYQEQKDTVEADVIVFGHTHFASSHVGKKKLFINSGCWVGEDSIIDDKQRYTNTFVYIDENGAYILKWGKGKIACIEDFPIPKG